MDDSDVLERAENHCREGRGAESSSRSRAGVLAPLAATVTIGLAFSILPYALWLRSTGSGAYIADKDNQYYLQLASRAYFSGGFSLSDVTVPGGATMYQAAQFIPAVALVRLLRLPPLDVNLVWRVWAGIVVPLLLYLLFFRWLRSPWASAFCAIVMMADCGITFAQPVLMQVARTFQFAAGHLPVLYDGQDLLGQWRVVDPAVGMPLLLLQILLVSAAVEDEPQLKKLIAAGIATGALFYVWFYYWTSAAVALALAFVLDRRSRRAYAALLGVALIIGGPAVVMGLLAKSRLDPQALQRIGVFAPGPRFGFFLLPKAALFALLITGVWIWRKPRRDGLYLWCIAVAAIALSNNHVINGLDLRAGHWRYVWGVSVSILVLLMVTQVVRVGLRARPKAPAMLALAVLLFEVAAGLTFRKIEVERAINSRLVWNGYNHFVSQTSEYPSRSFPAGAVIAGDSEFCALESIVSGTRPLDGYAAFLSVVLNDRDWETRAALNARLEGLNERQFREEADDAARGYGWGQSADPQILSMVKNGMMQAYARVGNAFEADIRRFDVSYVAIPATRPAPDYLNHGWRQIESGPSWRIWERD